MCNFQFVRFEYEYVEFAARWLVVRHSVPFCSFLFVRSVFLIHFEARKKFMIFNSWPPYKLQTCILTLFSWAWRVLFNLISNASEMTPFGTCACNRAFLNLHFEFLGWVWGLHVVGKKSFFESTLLKPRDLIFIMLARKPTFDESLKSGNNRLWFGTNRFQLMFPN